MRLLFEPPPCFLKVFSGILSTVPGSRLNPLENSATVSGLLLARTERNMLFLERRARGAAGGGAGATRASVGAAAGGGAAARGAAARGGAGGARGGAGGARGGAGGGGATLVAHILDDKPLGATLLADKLDDKLLGGAAGAGGGGAGEGGGTEAEAEALAVFLVSKSP